MKADYICHFGDDLMVVNCARVSFNKTSEWKYKYFETEDEAEDFALNVDGEVDWEYVASDRWFGGYPVRWLSDRDFKLIEYLARHDHWTPFGHPQVQFRIAAPVFVMRQLLRHEVGRVVSEVSRRYVDDEPEFYRPTGLRDAASNVKQGSGEGSRGVHSISVMFPAGPDHNFKATPDDAVELCAELYNTMIDEGVCPEQARMYLPQSMYTETIITGSLYYWSRVCRLRLDSHAQKEIRELTAQISNMMNELFPVSWYALGSFEDGLQRGQAAA